MKKTKLPLKEIGIILSYLYMLIACYLFDWKPFGIFISYLIEVVVLFLIYAVLRIRDKNQHPERYRKVQPIVNVFIGIIPLVGVQFLIILLVSGSVNEDNNFLKTNPLLTKEVLYAVIFTLVFYIIQAVQISGNNERVLVFQGDFLFKTFAITATNMVGTGIIFLGAQTLLPVLTGTVIVRIGLEIYFERKMNKEA